MKKVDDLLSNFFDSAYLSEGKEYINFQSRWSEIIGLDLATHIKIYDLKDHCLITETDHPGWAQMFLLRKKAILKKINKKFPQLDVRSIQIRYQDKWLEVDTEIKTEKAIRNENVEIDEDFFDLINKFKERSES